MKKKQETTELVKMENFLDYNQAIKKSDNTFEKLMLIYSMGIRELETKIDILKDEYKIFYDYDLIDHVNTRIKSSESIIKKMQDRNLECTYREMIENINDIAGIRIICPLKKDIFSVRDLVKRFPGVLVLKEKDYVTKPKQSGYSSYHMILQVPITLSQDVIYVKVEVQIRTLAMDFWASLEHNMKYKTEEDIDKKKSNEWIKCAKMINKLDNKMMLLN